MKYALIIIAILLGGFYGHTKSGVHVVSVERLQNTAKQVELERIKENIGPSQNQEEFAEAIWEASNTYRIPASYLMAIFGLESSYGRACVGHNCLGWGIYGSNRVDFNSYREAFLRVAHALALEKTYTSNKSLMAMFCVYNQGNPAPCSYGYKAVAFINEYEKN